MTQLSSKIEFIKLCDSLEKVTKERGSKKADELKKFIEECRKKGNQMKGEDPDADVSLYPVMRLLLPQLERERGPSCLKEKLLANLYIRVFCLGKGSKDALKLSNYKVPVSNKCVGSDFAETAYYTLRSRLPKANSSLTIDKVNSFLDDISRKTDGTHNKDDLFRAIVRHVSPTEFKWLTRIILKDLKLGVGTKRVLQAFHPEADQLFDLSSDLREICETLRDPETRAPNEIRPFFHVKPMLLERLRIEDAEKLFVDERRYYVQTKFDGERSQMHARNGRFKYFTRQGFDITDNPSYGEGTDSGGFLTSRVAKLLSPDCHCVILDGELMGWHKEKKKFGSKGMSYDVKRLSENSSYQPCFVAFDVLMYNDRTVTGLPYSERLELLSRAFKEEEGILIRCATTLISSSEELLQMFNRSLRDSEEGLVLKSDNVIYKPNVREGSGCYKLKAEYSDNLVQDVDLIILGGYYGEGKFMGYIKSFLVGVARPSETPGGKPSEFLSVASVSNGFTFQKLKELHETFEKHWLRAAPKGVAGPKSDPPDVWIEPCNSLIVKVRATELTRTDSYPAGYSLRFPRVLEVREDKPWYNACTLAELLSLIKHTGIVQKLTKRAATLDDIATTSSATKAPRISRTLLANSEDNYARARRLKAGIVPLTRLLDGKEICVINGDEEYTKERIEDVLAEHRARIVQTHGRNTFCVIAGNARTARVRNVVASNRYDVVTIDWFKRVTREENWSTLKDFLPWELLCARESTRERLADLYDEYYDSYTIDADAESLKRSFEKIGETVKTVEEDTEKFRKIDRYLFESGRSPFSMFRGIVAYFDDPSDYSKFVFEFLSGTAKENFDDSVTHVFVDGNPPNCEERYTNANGKLLKIVSNKWIDDCFERGEFLSDAQYLVRVF